MEKSNRLTKDDYNNVPVHYCETCLSLKILPLTKDSDVCYCGDCGNITVNTISIKGWEKLKNKRDEKNNKSS